MRGFVGSAPLLVDRPGDRVGEGAGRRVAGGRPPNEIDVEHPAVAVGQKGIVEVTRQVVELLGRCRGEIGTAVAPGGQEGAVFLEQRPGGDEMEPSQEIGQALGAAAVFPQALEQGQRAGPGHEGEQRRREIHDQAPPASAGSIGRTGARTEAAAS